MARRVLSNNDAVSMDSLMDTMTNVVGTLLLILIVVQLKVSTTASRLEESLSQVSQQQIEEAQLELEEARKNRVVTGEDWQKREAGEQKIYEAVAAKKEELGRHETTLKERGIKLLSLDEIEQQMKSRNEVVARLKQETSDLIAERSRVQALLDKTPPPRLPPPVDVIVPVSRPIPEDPDYVRVLVVSNRVFFVNDTLYKQTIQTEIARTPRLVKSRTPAVVYDHQLMLDFLNTRRLGDKNVEVNFRSNPTDDRITMEIKPRAGGGESMEEIGSAVSAYRAAITKLGRQTKSVLWFLVHPESIQTYLVARDECTRFKANAGWEFHGGTSYSERLPYPVNRLREPPAPRPGAKPAPRPGGSSIEIPRPKKTLD